MQLHCPQHISLTLKQFQLQRRQNRFRQSGPQEDPTQILKSSPTSRKPPPHSSKSLWTAVHAHTSPMLESGGAIAAARCSWNWRWTAGAFQNRIPNRKTSKSCSTGKRNGSSASEGGTAGTAATAAAAAAATATAAFLLLLPLLLLPPPLPPPVLMLGAGMMRDWSSYKSR